VHLTQVFDLESSTDEFLDPSHRYQIITEHANVINIDCYDAKVTILPQDVDAEVSMDSLESHLPKLRIQKQVPDT
jgi:hypothetical protein